MNEEKFVASADPRVNARHAMEAARIERLAATFEAAFLLEARVERGLGTPEEVAAVERWLAALDRERCEAIAAATVLSEKLSEKL